MMQALEPARPGFPSRVLLLATRLGMHADFSEPHCPRQ